MQSVSDIALWNSDQSPELAPGSSLMSCMVAHMISSTHDETHADYNMDKDRAGDDATSSKSPSLAFRPFMENMETMANSLAKNNSVGSLSGSSFSSAQDQSTFLSSANEPNAKIMDELGVATGDTNDTVSPTLAHASSAQDVMIGLSPSGTTAAATGGALAYAVEFANEHPAVNSTDDPRISSSREIIQDPHDRQCQSDLVVIGIEEPPRGRVKHTCNKSRQGAASKQSRPRLEFPKVRRFLIEYIQPVKRDPELNTIIRRSRKQFEFVHCIMDWLATDQERALYDECLCLDYQGMKRTIEMALLYLYSVGVRTEDGKLSLERSMQSNRKQARRRIQSLHGTARSLRSTAAHVLRSGTKRQC
jgi:hypothetical protein